MNSYKSVFGLDTPSSTKNQFENPLSNPTSSVPSNTVSVEDEYKRLLSLIKKFLDGELSMNELRAKYDTFK